MKSELHPLFAHVDDIPRIPEVVKILLEQVNDPEQDFDAITKNIEKDQLLSLRVLRIVNSVIFGLPKKIASINQALVVLGLDDVKQLVILSGVVNAVPKMANFNLKAFWLNSYRTACYAKWLAERSGHTDSSGMAFTATLLHNLGAVLIHLNNPKITDQLISMNAENSNRSDNERTLLGFTSEEVSAELCRLWHFPEELILTIEHSVDPINSDNASIATYCVFVASHISQSINDSEDPIIFPGYLPEKEWQHLGFKLSDIKETMIELFQLEISIEDLLG